MAGHMQFPKTCAVSRAGGAFVLRCAPTTTLEIASQARRLLPVLSLNFEPLVDHGGLTDSEAIGT
jgi:hypothetical protein